MFWKKLYLFIASYLIVAYTVSAQNPLELFERYQESHHLEKVYVNSDKSFYILGDTIWCKGYFLDGRTHNFFDASPVLNVEWINEELDIVQSMNTKIIDGTTTFQIPAKTSGEFTLRAYTRYQRNFDPAYVFQKSITVFSDSSAITNIPNKEQDYSVQFFPEGGELIAGLKNKLAFEAMDSEGNSLDVSGKIIDDKNKTVSSFKSFNDGLGFIEFKPEAGVVYSAIIDDEYQNKTFTLPSIRNTGYVLNVSARSLDFIQLSLHSNTNTGLKACRLIAHLRGQIIIDLPLDDVTTKQLKLSRADIPSGIIHFTLFDSQNQPVCERLSFNKNPTENVSLDIALAKEGYQKRELVTVDLKAYLGDESIASDASISVYNSDIIPQGTNELTIENYLLLQSDISSRIENIDQYFIKNDTKTNILLDNLLLTKGWRRFNWQDILENKNPIIEFDTEEEMTLVGRILKPNSDKPVKADVFLNTLSADDFGSYNMTTEEDGVFYFSGFNFSDTTDVIIQANVHNPKKKKKQKEDEIKRIGKKDVDIEMLSLDPILVDPAQFIKNQIAQNEQLKTIRNEFKEIQHYEKLYNPDWSIDLEEVTVKALRKTEKEQKLSDLEDLMNERNMIYVSGSQKIFMEDLPGGGTIYQDIFQIIRQRVVGAQVRGDGASRYVVLRGSNSFQEVTQAAFYLDGVRLNDAAGFSLDPNRILAIDVIRGLYAASLYGSDANGGVISIITKDPGAIRSSKTNRVKGTINIQHPGYFQAREFYTPSYEKKSIDTERPDFRSTLFWKGDLKLSKKLNQVQFYTGDRTGNFTIKVEGITNEGFPFVERAKLVVE